MNRRGFTLLEVLLVVALMVVLGAISWPSIEAMYGDLRLSAGADQIRGHWSEARTRAVEEGRSYRFAVVPGTSDYRIAPYDDGTSTGVEEGGSDIDPLSLSESLPKNVVFSDRSPNSNPDNSTDGYSTVVIFRPDGTADRDVEIVFQLDGCRPLQLKLRGLTGAVTTKTLKMGEQP